MKKIKIFLLCLFFVTLGTVGAVAGFYVNENSTAVVNWLNNTITVSKDNYKELLEESRLTVLQLTLEVESLEQENSQLVLEKEELSNRIAELEQSEEDNLALIEEYSVQIADLDNQITEKNTTIEDLQTLINSIYQDMMTELFVFPDELEGLSFSVYEYGEDFLILFSNKALYEFDYSKGELNFICSDYVTLPVIFESGYIYNKTVSSKYSVVFHSKSTGEDTVVVEGMSHVGCLEYENGCFIAFTDSTYYLNFETVTAVKSFDHKLGIGSGYINEFINYEDKLLLLTYAGNSAVHGAIYCMDYETKVGGVLVSDISNSGGRYIVFTLKSKLYLLVSSFKVTATVKGLYELNVVDYSYSLIYEFASQTSSTVGDFYVNEEVAIFGHQKYLYVFNGETVNISIDGTSSSISTTAGDFIKFYETETYEYLAHNTRWIKLDKANKTLIPLSFTSTYHRQFNLSDGRLVIVTKASNTSSVKMYIFNFETETFDYFLSTVTDFCFEHEGKVYYISDFGSYDTLYYKDLETSKTFSLGTTQSKNANINSVEVIGDVLLFYSNNQYILYCPTRSVVNNKLINSYDATMSNFAERTFYNRISTLTNGIAYEKIVYNEDFTDYTKTLVLVK